MELWTVSQDEMNYTINLSILPGTRILLVRIRLNRLPVRICNSSVLSGRNLPIYGKTVTVFALAIQPGFLGHDWPQSVSPSPPVYGRRGLG
jgi:hypothetical protein